MLSPFSKPSIVNYPLLYVTPTGTISVLLHNDAIVEITVDRSIRVVCHDKFAVSVSIANMCFISPKAASNSRGTSSCIVHDKARIFQQDTKVFSSFGLLACCTIDELEMMSHF
jgi:hypothetical protein